MKFNKTFLRDLAYEDHDNTVVELVDIREGESRRWYKFINQVFRFKGKLYQTTYQQGLTECQDMRPYEDDPDQIECPEVKPVEVTKIEYIKC